MSFEIDVPYRVKLPRRSGEAFEKLTDCGADDSTMRAVVLRSRCLTRSLQILRFIVLRLTRRRTVSLSLRAAASFDARRSLPGYENPLGKSLAMTRMLSANALPDGVWQSVQLHV